MGTTHGFAFGRVTTEDRLELVCSYDLAGNIIQASEAVGQVLGYSRDEFLGTNVGAILGEKSWNLTRGQILGQVDGSPQNLEVVAMTKQGGQVLLAVNRRVLFESGRPIAVQEIWRRLSPADKSGERSYSRTDAESQVSTNVPPSLHFAGQLKQLSRLSTT